MAGPLPPPIPPPVMPPNDDRGSAAVTVYWTLTVIAAFFVAARFYSRWMIRGLGLDDWMVLFTWILFTIASSMLTRLAQLGGFKHLLRIDPGNLGDVAFYTLLAQSFTIYAFGTGKFAVGYQLLRVMRTSTFQRSTTWFIWIVISACLLYNIIEGVLTMFQCSPVKKAWEPFTPGECWSMRTKLINIYAGGGFNITTDVILALLPLPLVWNLKMSLRTRIRLCALLSLGLMAAICSSVKLSYAHTLNNEMDITWGTYELVVWSGGELFVIIVCCCIPTLHVLWQRIVHTGPYTRKGSSNRSGYANGSEGSRMGKRFSKIQSSPRRDDLEGGRMSPNSTYSTTALTTQPHEFELSVPASPPRKIEAVTEIKVSSVPSSR